MFKLKYLSIFFVIFLFVVASPTTSGVDFEEVNVQDWIDSNIPESWYEAPKTVSELGIKEFDQSPMLDDEVKNGELPSVDKRLPKDPPAIEPYDKIGEYGGTFQSWGTDLEFHGSSGGGVGVLQSDTDVKLGRSTPDGKEVVPHLAKGWESFEEGKVWRIYLREGIKWSDGEPLSADDYMFWWNHIASNEDLNPVPPEKWDPPISDVKKIDDYTVEFHFGKAEPTLGDEFHRYFRYGVNHPAHFLKQYHIEFRKEEELLKEAEEAGFDNWYEYYEYNSNALTYPDRTRPTLLPYIAKERTTEYVLAERNPYYPFVDTEGNQLPYIDKVRINLASNEEMQIMKHYEGDATLAARTAYMKNIPAYRNNTERGGYKLLQYTNYIPGFCVLHPNLSHEDEKIHELLNNPDFRKALSLAINREEINDRVFFGQATPMQATALPGSSYFEPEFAESYIEFKPEKAKSILNDIGMVDVDDDEKREMPNEDDFTLRITYSDLWGPMTSIMELIQAHLIDVGLDVQLELLDWGLVVERRVQNQFMMSFMQTNTAIDLVFPRDHEKIIPSNHGYHPAQSMVPAYYRYWDSDGLEGIEPPEYFQKIKEKVDILRYTPDDEKRIEVGKELLEQNAEELWSISTVGLPPKPVVIKNLYNIPKKGLWTDDMQYLDPMYPIQFYMKE